ncbi:MAG: hypothetical protein AAF797_11480 [Planctomycetota bacterium]
MDARKRHIGEKVCRGVAVAGVLSLCAVLLGVSWSCARSPFTEKRDRTQYDRYLALRGEFRPTDEPDEFGVDRKALRLRLTPPDDR